MRTWLQALAHHSSLGGAPGADHFLPLPLPTLFSLPVMPFPRLILWIRTGGGHSLIMVCSPLLQVPGGILHPVARRAVGRGGHHAQWYRIRKKSRAPPLSTAQVQAQSL